MAYLFFGALAAVLSATPSESLGPAELPSTALKYRIEARLDPIRRQVTATAELRWRNPAPTAIDRVPVHLYMNAFSHTDSTWIDSATSRLGLDLEKYAELHGDPWGAVEVSAVQQRVASGERLPCQLAFIQPDDGNPLDRSLGEIALAEVVAPAAELVLELEFSTRLPIPIARTGGHLDYFHVAQWYPKLGVYHPPGPDAAQPGGWAARQFHGPTEFYADFADFEVWLEVPEGFAVVATGSGEPVPATQPGHQRWHFRQRAVHDFAWTTGRGLHLETHTHNPAGGGPPIAITYVTAEGTEHQVPAMRRAAELTFDVLGARVGPYPFSTMTVVQPPWKAIRTSGMEYPTLVTTTPGDPLADVAGIRETRISESTIMHEIIHNYFQGMVANDEQNAGFLDEGFTSYWTEEVVEEATKGGEPWSQLFGYPIDTLNRRRYSLAGRAKNIAEPLIKRPANLFYPGTNGAQIYTRAAVLLQTAENLFGRASVDRLFAEYFRRYRFRHPTAADFLAVVDDVAPAEMAAFLHEGLYAPRVPDYYVAKAESKKWQPPLGHVHSAGQHRKVNPDNREALATELFALDPAARERDGRMLIEITDPGFVDDDHQQDGRVERRRVAPSTAAEPREPDYHRSEVLLRGPGWRHLPVDVRFRFADGVRLVDTWDGRATWRRYRFVRPAELLEVQIDPEDRLKVDPTPYNNGLLLQPDTRLATDVSAWLTKVVQWLVLGAAAWL